ncbi:MAG: flippase [Patescibacteria group bacterium]|nr:flippase [Patescibacteria group bacterium]
MLARVKSFLFKNASTRQRIAKNTFWLSVSNFGGRLIRAVVIIYAARLLGAEGWGVFSYGVTLAAFLTPFTDVGISQVLIRETAKNPDPVHRARILSTTLFLKFVLIVAGVAIVLFGAPLFTTIAAAKPLLPIIAFLLAFDALREFGASVIRAMERMEWEAGLFLLTNTAIVIFGFVFLAVVPTPASFTYAYALGIAAGTVATFFALRRQFPPRFFSQFAPELVKPIFSSAWPLSLAALLGLLMLNTDVLMVGWLRSAEDVGFYSAVYRIVQLLYIIPSILAVSAFPAFSRLATTAPPLMKAALEKTLTAIFLIALPLAAGGIVLAPHIISFLFGTEFLPGTDAFRILLLTLIVDFPVVILSNALFAYHRSKALTVYATIGGLSNVALNLLLIPQFGIAGCAWATFIAQIASTAYLWGTLRTHVPFAVFTYLPIAIVSTLAMTAITLLFAFIGVHVIGIIALGGIVYALALYLLKEPLLKEARHAILGG